MTVEGTNISMIRGDSESIVISCSNPDSSPLPLVDGDVLYFTVKKDTTQTTKILQKVITSFDDGKAIIDILPDDTKSVPFGSYVYDIQLNRASGEVTTIVTPSNFTLLGEVTYE